MRRFIIVSLLMVFAFTQMTQGEESLIESFANPPAQARPWVYWWWMDHVSEESITRDLEALKAQGA